MAVYAIFQSNIVDQQKIDEYGAQAAPMVIGAGGKILVFDEKAEVVEGDPPGTRTVLIEFEDRDSFRSWYDSDDYQKVIGMRLEAAPGTMVVADSFEMPA
jgi:uncharacterized protein (DUF1330 family)